jgi:hypothetical protein
MILISSPGGLPVKRFQSVRGIMSIAEERLLPAVGRCAAERRVEQTQIDSSPAQLRELGVAVVWAAFYILLAIAAAIRHVMAQ